jgi:YgiT-type zinc finger domain-containing protein
MGGRKDATEVTVAKYEYDDCTYCGGRVVERRIQKPCFWGDKLIALVDRVPTGVCEQCGERYYRATVLKRIETKLKARSSARQIRLPVIEYSARI